MEVLKMTEKIKTNKTVWLLVAVAGGVISAAAIYAIVNKQTTKPEYVGQAEGHKSLEDIIKSAQSWDAAFEPWYGKAAPDFTVTDINGLEHSLSGYLGKNVLVVFWATWCPACNLEIPHLIELRNKIGEDDLAIVSISNEDPGHLKHFADAKGMNYAIAAIGNGGLPSPFVDVTSIPTTFFIDGNGQIKLAALGLVTLEETMAILKAEQ